MTFTQNPRKNSGSSDEKKANRSVYMESPDTPYEQSPPLMHQDNQLSDDIMRMYGIKPFIASFNGNSSGPGSQTYNICCTQLRNPRDYKFGYAKAYKVPLFGNTRSVPNTTSGWVELDRSGSSLSAPEAELPLSAPHQLNDQMDQDMHSEEEKAMFVTPVRVTERNIQNDNTLRTMLNSPLYCYDSSPQKSAPEPKRDNDREISIFMDSDAEVSEVEARIVAVDGNQIIFSSPSSASCVRKTKIKHPMSPNLMSPNHVQSDITKEEVEDGDRKETDISIRIVGAHDDDEQDEEELTQLINDNDDVSIAMSFLIATKTKLLFTINAFINCVASSVINRAIATFLLRVFEWLDPSIPEFTLRNFVIWIVTKLLIPAVLMATHDVTILSPRDRLSKEVSNQLLVDDTIDTSSVMKESEYAFAHERLMGNSTVMEYDHYDDESMGRRLSEDNINVDLRKLYPYDHFKADWNTYFLPLFLIIFVLSYVSVFGGWKYENRRQNALRRLKIKQPHLLRNAC